MDVSSHQGASRGEHAHCDDCKTAVNVITQVDEDNANIAFARGGAHLPIAHALRLPETDIISWGGDFFGWG